MLAFPYSYPQQPHTAQQHAFPQPLQPLPHHPQHQLAQCQPHQLHHQQIQPHLNHPLTQLHAQPVSLQPAHTQQVMPQTTPHTFHHSHARAFSQSLPQQPSIPCSQHPSTQYNQAYLRSQTHPIHFQQTSVQHPDRHDSGLLGRQNHTPKSAAPSTPTPSFLNSPVLTNLFSPAQQPSTPITKYMPAPAATPSRTYTPKPKPATPSAMMTSSQTQPEKFQEFDISAEPRSGILRARSSHSPWPHGTTQRRVSFADEQCIPIEPSQRALSDLSELSTAATASTIDPKDSEARYGGFSWRQYRRPRGVRVFRRKDGREDVSYGRRAYVDERIDWVERSERNERNERSERGERIERSERSERSDRERGERRRERAFERERDLEREVDQDRTSRRETRRDRRVRRQTRR